MRRHQRTQNGGDGDSGGRKVWPEPRGDKELHFHGSGGTTPAAPRAQHRNKAIQYQRQVAPLMLKTSWCSRRSSDLGPVLRQTSDASSATCYWCHLGLTSDDLYEMGLISFPIKTLRPLLHHTCPRALFMKMRQVFL